MKILNLYAGIGGNRKLWGNENEITAIEWEPEIARLYSKFFPNDKVLIEDAHAYLLNYFREYDFIWASPPCPSHSRVRMNSTYSAETGEPIKTPVYPDMRLYEEIILLDYFFKGKFVVENVISFYEPLIKPYIVGSHYFWANFPLANFETKPRLHDYPIPELERRKGFDLSNEDIPLDLKRKVLHNCVEPEVGKAIFNYAFKGKQELLNNNEVVDTNTAP